MTSTKKNENAVLSSWEKLTAEDQKTLNGFISDYMAFLDNAKTERLAHDQGVAIAKKAGFKDIQECIKKNIKLKPGDKVYRSCRGKTLFLAQIGKAPIEKGLVMVGSHIDSPRLDAKPRPIYEKDGIVYMDTHYYGGIKKYQWLTLPLALYGVVYKRDGSQVKIAIGDKPKDPVFYISDLLPHLDKEGPGKTVEKAFNGEQLDIIIGSKPLSAKERTKDLAKQRILDYFKKNYGIEEEDFVSAELEIVPAGQTRFLGLDGSMLVGYGHDDRVCAYSALRAIIEAKGISQQTRACVICDKEEIGSYGATGMDSCFIENTVAELVALTTSSYSELAVRRALENSNMLSADVNSLHDPLFASVSAPNGNMSKLNEGISISKYTGARGKSGASDASAEFLSTVRKIFNDAKVIWQMGELGKVDVGGGGTIALYLARYGMNVLDCGVGLLSMHAPYEVAGTLDIYEAFKAYKAFYEAF